MGRFDDRVALVTGAASGIGRATAIRLASEGARIYGADIDPGGLEATAKLVEEAGSAMAFERIDVAHPTECEAAVEAAVARFERLDVLCNVAGIARPNHVADVTEDEWNHVLAVNLSGTFFMCQAAIPYLLETDGSIVNVASNAGLTGQAYNAAYCASKGGVVQLTRALAMEFVKQPIRINCVAPAGTDTALVRSYRFPEGGDMGLIKRYMSYRGLAEAEDIAASIAFLASDEARHIHGAVLSIDDGITAG